MSWTGILTGSARRDLRRLDPLVTSRMLDALDRLATAGQGDTQLAPSSGADVMRATRMRDQWAQVPTFPPSAR